MSQESAFRKIAAEKRNQTGKLDLSNEKLAEIPMEVLELKHLQYLELHNNHISYIGILIDLPKLKFLNLSYNYISNYHILENIHSLQSLTLGDNKVSDYSFLENMSNLQSLNVSFSNIPDHSFLENMSNLKFLKLNVSYNSDISSLGKLIKLLSLDLSNNNNLDYSFLEKLPNLQSLNLNNNKISDYSFLEKLTNLRSLNLNSTQFFNYSFLEKLANLQSLDLGGNNILNYNFLGKLPNLKSINLGQSFISDCSFLEKLTNLKSINLSHNNISDCSFLVKLSNLKSINLSYNNISDCSLEKLFNLESINLSHNNISDFSFEKLPNLLSLDLSENNISDCSFLEKLHNLKSLNLSDNFISDISFLKNLSNLESLNLSENDILDIRFLMKLTELRSLLLQENNSIINIASIRYLKNLIVLNLGGNQISDISSLRNLKNLNEIGLTSNQIKKLPEWILDFNLDILYDGKSNDNIIQILDNPIESPPIEIVKKGHDEIIKYFSDLEKQGKDYLYEAKLLIVGDGGAGKTSLAWKMKELDSGMPKEGDDRTKGIDIQALPIQNLQKPELPFLMNVWDFGGQGYYHSTHQFFLTKRSLYVLLNNTRINKTDFNDWLQTISLFSDNSPVILVENEVGEAKSELDLRGLQQHFDNILYVRIADISNTTDGRLEKLIQDIQIEIQRLPHIGSELPKQWVKVRESLQEVAKTKAYITDKEFYKICEQHNITEKEAIQRLGGLFHDLGIFLYFRKDKVLKRTVILQNAWATKGVYTILDDDLVRSQNGYFTIEQADKIWKNTPYEEMQDELVCLMEKFRLCYRIPYSSPDAYISPNLLPVEKPDYTWIQNQNLIIYFDYEFMPKGLLGMFIVELHRYVKDIKKLAWRNGCIFNHQNTDAQVIETYGKQKLEIRIKGAHCVHLSSIIISAIDRLNASFKRIKVKKLIPCPCNVCKESNRPEFYNYDNLMRRKAKNKATIECSSSYDDIKVLEILEASYNEQYIEAPTIIELIAKGQIKEAIDSFEQEFPDEAILQLAKFNRFKRDYDSGLITSEEWSVHQQKIADSLISLSEN